MRSLLALFLVIALTGLVLLWPRSTPPHPEGLSPRGSQETAEDGPTGLSEIESRTPALGPEEEYLQKVVDQLGLPDELPDYPPKSLGQHIASRLAEPLFPTRMAALEALVEPAELNTLLNCLADLQNQGVLPMDWLTKPLDEPAVIWDPVGEEYVIESFTTPVGPSPASAAKHYQERFLLVYGVQRGGGSGRLDFAKKSRYNPHQKTIDEATLEVLRTIEGHYADQIFEEVALVLTPEFVNARDIAIAKGDYVALPFNAIRLFSSCGGQDRHDPMSKIVTGTSGWSSRLTVDASLHPPYGDSLAKVRNLVEQRDSEFIAVIAAL